MVQQVNATHIRWNTQAQYDCHLDQPNSLYPRSTRCKTLCFKYEHFSVIFSLLAHLQSLISNKKAWLRPFWKRQNLQHADFKRADQPQPCFCLPAACVFCAFSWFEVWARLGGDMTSIPLVFMAVTSRNLKMGLWEEERSKHD